MIRSIGLIVFFMGASFFSYGQLEKPERRKFNIGTFVGIGGASLTPIPTVDIRYRGTSLRLAPGYKYNGLGITQELFPISKSFYNVFWLASVYYVKGIEKTHAFATTSYTSISALIGLKYYMGTRFFSELQFGVETRKKTTPGYESSNAVSPYFEFGIGVNVFKNFPRKFEKINVNEE
jgi:hypothetical protein